MPTYRVSIRRPTTQPPIWDWAQTVVSTNQQTAIADGYQNWVDSKPAVAPPPLNQCTAQAVQK
jgi:hypothetical protein